MTSIAAAAAAAMVCTLLLESAATAAAMVCIANTFILLSLSLFEDGEGKG